MDLIQTLVFSFFFVGVARGTAVCTFICGAGIVPYIVLGKKNPAQAFKISFLFSLPRIIFLTILGIVIGAVSYGLNSLSSALVYLQNGVYILYACILIIAGFYLFARSMEEHRRYNQKDLCSSDKSPVRPCEKNCSSSGNSITAGKYKKEKKNSFFSGIRGRIFNIDGKRENYSLLIMGSLLGVGCLTEMVFLEGSLLTGLLISTKYNITRMMLLGASGMFLFALGLSFPLITISTLSAKIFSKIDSYKGMNYFRMISSIFMMTIGVFVLFLVLVF